MEADGSLGVDVDTPDDLGLALLALLALGVSLVLGLWVRPASLCGLIYMLALLFSANYPGPDAPIWQYAGVEMIIAVGFPVASAAPDTKISSTSVNAETRNETASIAMANGALKS